MDRHEIRDGKVVAQRARYKRITNTLPRPEPISEDTARYVLAGQLVKVAGPEPIRGARFALLSMMVIGMLAVVYAAS